MNRLIIIGPQIVAGSYQDTGFQNSGAGTYTFTNKVPLRSENVLAVAVVSWRGNPVTIDDITLAGTSATIHEQVNSSDASAAIASVELTAGAAGNIFIDLSGLLGGNGSMFCAIYFLPTGSTYRDGDTGTGTTSASASVAARAGEFVVAAYCAHDGLGTPGAPSWTDPTENDTEAADRAQHSAASRLSGGETVTAACSSSGADASVIAVAAFQP